MKILKSQIYVHTNLKMNLIPGEGAKQTLGNGILFAHKESQL